MGKTTMVRILSTLIPADSGSMRIAGHDMVTDPDGVRAVIGVTGQFSAVDNPGGHVRLHFADPHLLHPASEFLETAAPDEDQLVLQVPADGTVDSLRGLLDVLHEARISVERLSAIPRTSTTCSSPSPAATSPRSSTEIPHHKEYRCHDHARLHAQRLAGDAPPQPVRGLLGGAPIGDHAIAAIAWSIGIAVVAYLWAIRRYNRRRAAEPK